MGRPIEQGMNLHGPTPGARVRVWGRGARGNPRGSVRRAERHLWKPQERKGPRRRRRCRRQRSGAVQRGCGGRGLVVRRPYAGEVFFPGEEEEGGEGGARGTTGRATGRSGSVGCV